MKRLLPFFAFFFALSVLGAQNGDRSANPLPRLDEAVKSLAGDINKKIVSEKAQKITVGQWTYNNTVPPFGFYWNSQLIEELTNIPGRSFTVLMGEGGGGADWTVSGEILEAAGTLRVYTRIVRTGDRSVVTGLHSDFASDPAIIEMLAGGGSGGRSSSTARDAYEPDSRDNPMVIEAAASSEDGPVINRTLHSDGDEDFFLLTPAAEGFLVIETTGNIDTVMDLYEAGSNSILADDDDGGSGGNARIRYAVQGGKAYLVRVRGYGGETGSYGFRAYLTEPVRVDPDEFENDDEPSSAGELSIGEGQRHTFSSGDDVDWVKFSISQPGRYVIRARGVNSNRLDTYIELYDQDFNTIDENDDGGDNYDARLSVRLQTGTYYVKVECLDENPDQPYTISIDTDNTDNTE
jgi:hypothetical protein